MHKTREASAGCSVTPTPRSNIWSEETFLNRIQVYRIIVIQHVKIENECIFDLLVAFRWILDDFIFITMILSNFVARLFQINEWREPWCCTLRSIHIPNNEFLLWVIGPCSVKRALEVVLIFLDAVSDCVGIAALIFTDHAEKRNRPLGETVYSPPEERSLGSLDDVHVLYWRDSGHFRHDVNHPAVKLRHSVWKLRSMVWILFLCAQALLNLDNIIAIQIDLVLQNAP